MPREFFTEADLAADSALQGREVDNYIRGALRRAAKAKEQPDPKEPASYEGSFGGTQYEVTVSPATKGGQMIDGMIAVTHDDPENDGISSRLGNSTAFVWYDQNGASSLIASIQDRESLRARYDSGSSNGSDPLTVHTFYRPFPTEGEVGPLDQTGERTYISDSGRLVYEKVLGDTHARAEFPVCLYNDFPILLGGQGELQLASDDGAAQEGIQSQARLTKKDIPQRYPASFTSVSRNRG